MIDALGSVANITNSTGTSVATYTYNPFGTQRLNTTSQGFVANPLKYTGQHLDPTGSYNLRARQHNPTHGRFTQVDPLAADTNGAYPSAYTYSNNNPTMFTDPSGMRVGFGEDGGIASASFATKDTPPTTKVIIRKGNRCVTTAATPAQRKKNPLAPSVVTKCTKIPAPTTTLRQRLFGQYSGQLVSGNFKSATVGFSWDLEQGKARFLSIDLVGHNLNAAESDDPKYSSAIFDFEICGPEGCYRRLAVNAQTTGPLLDVSRRESGVSDGACGHSSPYWIQLWRRARVGCLYDSSDGRCEMQLRRWLVVAFLISACGEEVKRPDRLAAEACAREALVLTSEEANTYWVRQRFGSDLPDAVYAGPLCEAGDPDQPAFAGEPFEVLRSVLKDPAFRVIEAKWSVCMKTAGYAWEDFDDPLSASSNVGTLIADFGALRSAMVAGIETPELRAAYETSVVVAERWAVPAVLVDRSCRAPYSKEIEVLIQKSKVD